MLDDLASHAVPLLGYPMSHVFLSESGELPSTEHLDQIKPLDGPAAKFLCDFEDKMKLATFHPTSGRYFRTTESLVYTDSDEQIVKKWLYERGLPFRSMCFVCFGSKCSFILTWKMVIHYSADLFWGQDVIVWDRSLNWALYHDHHDAFYFAKDRIYDGQAEQLKITELIRQYMPNA